MIETLATTVRALRIRLSQLENGGACPGDWVRLDVAATRAALVARQALGGLADDAVDYDELAELVDDLRYIKLCAESQLLGLSEYASRR